MTTVYEVPLSPEPQTFKVQLAGEDYQIRLAWNPMMLCWVIDLSAVGGDALIQGMPLVTGLDLLAQYKFLQIGGSLVVQTDFDPDAVPDLDSLGTSGHLYFVMEP